MRLGIVGSVGGALELSVGVDAIYYMCNFLALWRWHWYELVTLCYMK